MVAELFGMLLVAMVGAAIGAVFLRAGAKWAASMDIDWGRAYSTVLIVYLINMAFGFAIGLGLIVFLEFVGGTEETADAVTDIAALPIVFLVHVVVIRWRLGVTLGKAAVIVLIMFGLAFVIGVAIILLILAVSSALAASSHAC